MNTKPRLSRETAGRQPDDRAKPVGVERQRLQRHARTRQAASRSHGNVLEADLCQDPAPLQRAYRVRIQYFTPQQTPLKEIDQAFRLVLVRAPGCRRQADDSRSFPPAQLLDYMTKRGRLYVMRLIEHDDVGVGGLAPLDSGSYQMRSREQDPALQIVRITAQPIRPDELDVDRRPIRGPRSPRRCDCLRQKLASRRQPERRPRMAFREQPQQGDDRRPRLAGTGGEGKQCDVRTWRRSADRFELRHQITLIVEHLRRRIRLAKRQSRRCFDSRLVGVAGRLGITFVVGGDAGIVDFEVAQQSMVRVAPGAHRRTVSPIRA